jgi:hypothetical protein
MMASGLWRCGLGFGDIQLEHEMPVRHWICQSAERYFHLQLSKRSRLDIYTWELRADRWYLKSRITKEKRVYG